MNRSDSDPPLLHPSELAPGVWHWAVPCERIGAPLGSYVLEHPGGASLIDPALPAARQERERLLAALNETFGATEILLTTRAHRREVAFVAETLGIPILTHERTAASLELPRVKTYDYGDSLPARLRSLRVDGTSPGECALYRESEGIRQLFVGDALIHLEPWGLALLPEDHAADAGALEESVRALLELDFDQLFPGHGRPLLNEAAQAVREIF